MSCKLHDSDTVFEDGDVVILADHIGPKQKVGIVQGEYVCYLSRGPDGCTHFVVNGGSFYEFVREVRRPCSVTKLGPTIDGEKSYYEVVWNNKFHDLPKKIGCQKLEYSDEGVHLPNIGETVPLETLKKIVKALEAR